MFKDFCIYYNFRIYSELSVISELSESFGKGDAVSTVSWAYRVILVYWILMHLMII